MLGAFFDDSGTHADSSVVALGGLLGTEQQWDAFAQKWSVLLNRPLEGKERLPDFHLTHCRQRFGAFETWSLAERDRITYLFREVIFSVGLVTIAAAVNKIAWDALVVGVVEDELGSSPLELCFVKCIDFVIEIVRGNKPDEKVFVLMDQGTRRALEKWAIAYRAQPERYPEIEGIGLGPVKKEVGLQGADMIAYETYQYAIEWFKDRDNAKGNAHFQPFRNHARFPWGLGLTQTKLPRWLSALKRGAPQDGTGEV
jgi:hypothetical protein